MDGHGGQACVSLEVDSADAYYEEDNLEIRRPPKNEEWGCPHVRSPGPLRKHYLRHGSNDVDHRRLCGWMGLLQLGIMDSILTHMVTLAVGSTLAALLYEATAGNESFSLPFSNVVLVTVIGTVLSQWWGWTATLSVLGVYTAYSVVGGFLERFSEQVDLALPPPEDVSPKPAPVEEGLPDPAVRRTQALESGQSTDIVFRSDRPLMEIAEAIGLKNAELDGESYWEWVIGILGRSTGVDITRTHRAPPGDVDTRLFLVGGGVLADELKKTLVQRLRTVVPGTITCGQSIYLGGNDFDFVTLEEHS